MCFAADIKKQVWLDICTQLLSVIDICVHRAACAAKALVCSTKLGLPCQNGVPSALDLQMQEVRLELQQRDELVATLDAQLLESNEMVAHLQQLQAQASSHKAAKQQQQGKSGPAAFAGWVVKTGVTVGGTLLAGKAVQQYQAQQASK